jgi:carotenoid cleavage dioxygenase-like enzyme
MAEIDLKEVSCTSRGQGSVDRERRKVHRIAFPAPIRAHDLCVTGKLLLLLLPAVLLDDG